MHSHRAELILLLELGERNNLMGAILDVKLSEGVHKRLCWWRWWWGLWLLMFRNEYRSLNMKKNDGSRSFDLHSH